jgi:hypothetical protein
MVAVPDDISVLIRVSLSDSAISHSLTIRWEITELKPVFQYSNLMAKITGTE